MAVATPTAGAKETVRQKRERDQELLVWPDLVFIEFIAAVLFTLTFVVLLDSVRCASAEQGEPRHHPRPLEGVRGTS